MHRYEAQLTVTHSVYFIFVIEAPNYIDAMDAAELLAKKLGMTMVVVEEVSDE